MAHEIIEDEKFTNNIVTEEPFFKKRIDHYKENRENILSGNINCIPSPFPRFRSEFPGIEHGKYYLVTGNEKSGKSQISDFMFLLHPITYAFNNRDKLSVKILYFSLEMAQSEKFDQLTCYWLYNKTKGRVRIDTKQLNSLNAESPLDPEILELLEGEEYAEFFGFLEENVIFFESVGNPTGIYNQCLTFAEQRGTYTYKEIPWTDNKTKEVKMRRVIDTFERDNKEEYWIVITDHLSLLTTEKGLDLRETIGRFSSSYSVRLRNIYKFAIVNIQQQSAESQGNEAFKLDRLAPNPGNLAENKSTKNDLNIMLGIFAPVRFKKAVHLGYNISTFKDNIRFLEVVLNRSGSTGSVCPLYFDGAVNYFAELPMPDDTERLEFYKQLALEAQNR